MNMKAIFAVMDTTKAVYFYSFILFVYSPLHGFNWNQHSDQLAVGLLAQLVEHCTGITEVIGSNPVQAFFLLLLSSSVHSCEDRFHIYVLI